MIIKKRTKDLKSKKKITFLYGRKIFFFRKLFLRLGPWRTRVKVENHPSKRRRTGLQNKIIIKKIRSLFGALEQIG